MSLFNQVKIEKITTEDKQVLYPILKVVKFVKHHIFTGITVLDGFSTY